MLVPISKAAKLTHMTTANSAHNEQLEITDSGQIFFIYLFIRFAGISYGWFIAIRYKFKLSTYVQTVADK